MSKQAQQYIHSLICEAVPKSMSLDEIREASLTDVTIQQLRVIIVSGRWNDNVGDHLRLYKHIFNELSTCDGIVLRQSRIVIPKSCWSEPPRSSRDSTNYYGCVFCIIVLNAGHATQPCLLPTLFTPTCVSAAVCVHAIYGMYMTYVYSRDYQLIFWVEFVREFRPQMHV